MSLRSGICPNCDGREVHHDGVQLLRSADPLRVGLGGLAWRNHYVCVACGFTQDFVDRTGVQLIRSKWPRVEPRDEARNS